MVQGAQGRVNTFLPKCQLAQVQLWKNFLMSSWSAPSCIVLILSLVFSLTEYIRTECSFQLPIVPLLLVQLLRLSLCADQLVESAFNMAQPGQELSQNMDYDSRAAAVQRDSSNTLHDWVSSTNCLTINVFKLLGINNFFTHAHGVRRYLCQLTNDWGSERHHRKLQTYASK